MSEMTMHNGNYALDSIEEQMKYASFLMGKKLVSDTFKDPAQLIVAIQLCKDLGLPNSCLKDFYVIGGKPAIFGDTFVALATGSGLIEEHSVDFYDEQGVQINIPKKGDKLFSCVVSGRRKGSSLTSQIAYSMDDLHASGNRNPNFSKHPKDMLFRRAMGRFAKWICPDAIRGVEMADYAEEAQRNQFDDMRIALNEDADRIRAEQTPKEELVVGPLYRFQAGKFRSKQMYEVSFLEMEEYLQTLKLRTTIKKAWEVEMINVIETYLANKEIYSEQILELNSK